MKLTSQSERVKQHMRDCRAELDLLSQQLDDVKTYEKDFSGFMKLYKQFLTSKPIEWDRIETLPATKFEDHCSLPAVPEAEVAALLKRLVIVKLNGGLGTTMGCSFPKSLITVREGQNFLDITMLHLEALNKKYDSDVPLVIMNSFSTTEATEKYIRQYAASKTKIYTFKQNQYPRISANLLLPIFKNEGLADNASCWYPPGHGNVYVAFYESGLMEHFIAEGRDILFVANIDNLGSTVDIPILNVMANEVRNGKPIEFLMEVTEKTKADVKGGTLIKYENKIHLLEGAQVPKEHMGDFQSVRNFKIFNTNNLWVNANSVLARIQREEFFLDVICNRKTLASGLNVIQLETAAGAAVKNFENTVAIKVERSRFLPVKNNSDLLLVMSNVYELVDGKMVMNRSKEFKNTPLVQLSGPHFKTVKEFLSRFQSVPDILELDQLSVSGDVFFDTDITLKGTVIIVSQHGDHIDIPRGSIIENKIIAGNLRILDH